MSISDLGWPATGTRGAFRVGPHLTGGGNDREIEFRDDAIADLQAATMWLIHTGDGGRLPDYPVTHWHGARALDAGFGSKRSDHHAKVAADINWFGHPWEVAIGEAIYDQHMKQGGRVAKQHALFAAVERRLGRIIRWCGRPWRTDGTDRYGGFLAYPRGHRDCMHFVIATRNRAKIDAAHRALLTWFRPPRTPDDIRELQRRLGITADGIWGRGSVATMRAEQRRLGVPQTGLPGDVATREAWAKDDRREAEALRDALAGLGYRAGDARLAARETGFTGDVDDHARLTKHLEETMAKIDDLIDEIRELRREVRETPREVWGHDLYGVAAHWYLRRGSLGFDLDHPQYPADPGSPADLELRVAEAVLGEEITPYNGSQRR